MIIYKISFSFYKNPCILYMYIYIYIPSLMSLRIWDAITVLSLLSKLQQLRSRYTTTPLLTRILRNQSFSKISTPPINFNFLAKLFPVHGRRKINGCKPRVIEKELCREKQRAIAPKKVQLRLRIQWFLRRARRLPTSDFPNRGRELVEVVGWC